MNKITLILLILNAIAAIFHYITFAVTKETEYGVQALISLSICIFLKTVESEQE